jgi:PqqD family protein of HPr-rel-A system
MSNRAPTWTARHPLRFAEWQERDDTSSAGEVIVFQPATGNLHLVTREGAAVLKALRESALTADELATRLAAKRSQHLSTTEMDRSFLIPFNSLGLIERTNPW